MSSATWQPFCPGRDELIWIAWINWTNFLWFFFAVFNFSFYWPNGSSLGVVGWGVCHRVCVCVCVGGGGVGGVEGAGCMIQTLFQSHNEWPHCTPLPLLLTPHWPFITQQHRCIDKPALFQVRYIDRNRNDPDPCHHIALPGHNELISFHINSLPSDVMWQHKWLNVSRHGLR